MSFSWFVKLNPSRRFCSVRSHVWRWAFALLPDALIRYEEDVFPHLCLCHIIYWYRILFIWPLTFPDSAHQRVDHLCDLCCAPGTRCYLRYKFYSSRCGCACGRGEREEIEWRCVASSTVTASCCPHTAPLQWSVFCFVDFFLVYVLDLDPFKYLTEWGDLEYYK